ncbi:branched-chain-amino-acid transaminase [Agrobacterium tumefaciens]|uniref:branched-chain-amino-acid transaminase n=1 Tax=Agrobacterium tumefaciens TaxID=358 RepID=UPI0015732559|nr:branched-chain-amino-acid transaminase [Agrobacterium tumefaciens]NTE65099.1 branched-chain-amino-acid transaminase [Agrobacterium tumefaciens]
MTLAPFASINGKIIPWDKATIHAFSPAAKYGIGVFEGVRGYWSEERGRLLLFRMDDHLKRLAYSQRAVRFHPVPGNAEIDSWTVDLLKACSFRESTHIRIMSYLDGQGDMSVSGPISVAITALARPVPPAVTTGVQVQVSSWIRIADRAMPARIKANANYHNSRLAHMQAIADGYQNAFILNERGNLAEAPTATPFIVRDGVLITPALSEDVLESITRDTILRLAADHLGLRTEERVINRSELHAADEAFICGTGAEVTPVLGIDRIAVGDGRIGPIVKMLQDAYFDLVHGRLDFRSEWLREVSLETVPNHGLATVE